MRERRAFPVRLIHGLIEDRAAGNPELPALLDVVQRVIEGTLTNAEHRRGEDQPLHVEARHELRPALIHLSQDRRLLHLDAVQV